MVSRLCAPIEGTDAARLADCLGLDAAKYHSKAGGPGSGGVRDALEDAQLAACAMLDSDARYKAWQPRASLASLHALPFSSLTCCMRLCRE